MGGDGNQRGGSAGLPVRQGFTEDCEDLPAFAGGNFGMVPRGGVTFEDFVEPGENGGFNPSGESLEGLGVDHVGTTVFEDPAVELKVCEGSSGLGFWSNHH